MELFDLGHFSLLSLAVLEVPTYNGDYGRRFNTFMLGFVSVFLPIRVATWGDCISQRILSNILRIKINAFDQGRKET